jgi:hypothetical protein
MNELTLNIAAKQYLRESIRWGKFLAIVGLVITGFIVIGAIFAGTILGVLAKSSSEWESIPAAAITFIYLVMAGIYFFPCWFQFKSSQRLQIALDQNNEEELAEGLKYMKYNYQIFGILTAVMLVFYVLGIILAIIAGGIATTL